ncbi:MAG: sulfurtransferase TusA family protein [Thermodesulfobacteriota bacterium]
MTTTIDARGLSCPQPVLMTLDAIQSGSDTEFIILVDTDTSRENVTRAATSKGFRVADLQPDNQGYRLTIHKG